MCISRILSLFLLISFIYLSPVAGQKQSKKNKAQKQVHQIDSDLFKSLKWRNIGPFRGGRSVAVSGVINDNQVYYMGSIGGGLWKTNDAGISWKNISDKYFETGSVGAIGICESDPNVIYVGMGEHSVRGVMTTHGDGVYKSVDAGKKWEHVGLEQTMHISDVIVHPNNPDIVYVAAQGALYGPSQERGIFKTIDGGKSWQKVKYLHENTGASSISMDMNNPRILYAAFWDHQRYPWTIRSGGPNSGIYKTNDAGATWEKLEKGLPKQMGKSGISVSRANPERVFAVIEAEGEKSGVYRSDDGGKTWNQTSKDRIAITRSWYYMEIFADPVDEETVYVLNAPMLKSIDGGKSFTPIAVPHGDNHDMWINPANHDNIINANDGGANITFNGGKSWSTQRNQPTAQFYRVITDNQFPYNVYGGQQDNSAISIASRTDGVGITWKDWHSVAGGESAYLAFDPDDPKLIYGGSYQGNIDVYDSRTGQTKDIMAYPVIGLGSIPKDMKYRFNWNAPIIASPHDPSAIYHAGNVLLKTTDQGQNWTIISPDLTRNDTTKQGPGGVPFTIEGAGGEIYNTIIYVAPSLHEKGTIWVGTDDGLLHLTRDEGGSWQNVTPEDLPESIINCIEVSPHDPARAYFVATRYKFNDLSPIVYKTIDYGETWTKIIDGIEKNTFARAIRADRKSKGLLYLGTELGLYLSFDDGENWQKFQLNLPSVPINDLAIQDNDLVAATSGRSFWILDDLGAIQQSMGDFGNDSIAIFQPKTTVKFTSYSTPEPVPGIGTNPMSGVIIDYYLASKLDTPRVLTMEVLDLDGEIIRTITNIKDENFEPYPGGPVPKPVLPTEKGLNRFAWDFRRSTIPHVPDVFVMGNYQGSKVAPGKYNIRLMLEEDTVNTTVEIIPDPRLDASPSDFIAQEELLNKIDQTVTELHESVVKIRNARKQIQDLEKLLRDNENYQELIDTGKAVIKKINTWEERLIQPRQKTFQDVINFPNQLNAELLNLKERVDGHNPKPTTGALARYDDLENAWLEFKAEMDVIINEDFRNYNELYKKLEVPAIILEE